MSETAVTFETTPEFNKDLKKHSRKHRSLPEDIEDLKTALKVAHFTDGISSESMGFFPISHPEVPEASSSQRSSPAKRSKAAEADPVTGWFTTFREQSSISACWSCSIRRTKRLRISRG